MALFDIFKRGKTKEEVAAPAQAAVVAEEAKAPSPGEMVDAAISAGDLKQARELVKQTWDAVSMKGGEDETNVLPVSAGRSSIATHDTLMMMVSNYVVVAPKYRLEMIEAIENLAIYNPDVSNAIENIGLANTPFKIKFDTKVPDRLAKEMQEHITMVTKNWYGFSDGINGLSNDLLAQAGTGGALSFEAIPKNDLSGVKKIVLVSGKYIWFDYDKDKDVYSPLQKIPNNIGYSGDRFLGLYKKLNEATYRYIALRKIGDTPYGIPPFLAALESILIQRDMNQNLKTVMKKLGLLGFLKVILNKPMRMPKENDTEYDARLQIELDKNAEVVAKGFAKGFLLGYNDKAGASYDKIDMQGTTGNVGGAEKLVNINDTYVLAGLKFDPAMMGRSSTTTETFGRVVLAKMATQLGNYQNLVAAAYEFAFDLELRMAGYKYAWLKIKFDKVLLGDKLKEAQARGEEIDNAAKLYAMGMISQDGAAQELGYEEADVPEPRAPFLDKNAVNTGNNLGEVTTPGGGKKTAANSLNWEPIAGRLGLAYREYDYEGGHICTDANCSAHSHSAIRARFSFAGGGDVNDGDAMADDYLSESESLYNKAIESATRDVMAAIASLNDGASIEQVESLVMYHLYSRWENRYVYAQKEIVQKFIHNLYTYYRSDTAPFGDMKNVVKPSFSLIDIRAMKYYQQSDDFYLGKFITDKDTRKNITAWIKEKYLADSVPIGRGSVGIDLFANEFQGVLEGQAYKIRRVIDTTVTRMRATAAVSYIDQAEIKTFRIQTIRDSLQCRTCAALQGAVFSVQKEMSKIEKMTQGSVQDVPELSPFATSLLTPEEITKKTWVEVQSAGIAAPPYHCHCRCTVVADI